MYQVGVSNYRNSVTLPYKEIFDKFVKFIKVKKIHFYSFVE